MTEKKTGRPKGRRSKNPAVSVARHERLAANFRRLEATVVTLSGQLSALIEELNQRLPRNVSLTIGPVADATKNELDEEGS